MNSQRLQKILAQAGIASRRGAEQLIEQGQIAVNGQVVKEMGYRVDPARDTITYNGKQVTIEQKLYLLLNKPVGYVTTLSDPQGRPTVVDLVSDISTRLFPVGRLDMDTEGALLMTNDGELGNRILHPRYEVKKTYIATVKGSPSRDKLHRLEKGIILEGRMTSPAHITLQGSNRGNKQIQIIIHEGKKRQVRKMFQAIGHKVLRLKRTAYGGLTLGSLPSGQYRILSKNDLSKIFF